MLEEIISLGISKREATELIKVSKNIKKDLVLLKKGYPIQYLIGYVDFYGNKIIINASVLIPRCETEFLVEKVLSIIKKKANLDLKILDLCTGSGCISIALKKEIPSLEVYSSDISIKALNIAVKNFKNNRVKIFYKRSDLFNKIDKDDYFDVIVSNPPYISKKEKIEKVVEDNEPKLALYSKDEGLYHIKKIIIEGCNHLNKNGFLAIEIGSSQKKALENFMHTRLNKNIEFYFDPDLNNLVRYLFIFKK
jgi:release factor glutamine methyltransferase